MPGRIIAALAAAVLLAGASAQDAAYQARKRERRAASVKALEEGRKAVEEDRRAEAARQKALAEKLKNQKLSLKLKNGLLLENVVVMGFTRDEVKLGFTFEGAVAEQSFPVDFIEDKAYVSLVKAVHKGDGAAGAYEAGRRLVLRKLWKEAQAAFADCVKQDASFQPRVPDLARILNNEAAFKGSARRVGADQLFITYDFADAAAAQDFVAQPMQPGELKVEGGELRLASKATGMWTLKDVDFDREVEIDATVTLEEASSLVVGCFFLNNERKGYLAVVNGRAPAGHSLFRADGGKVEPIATQKEPRVPAGTETRIRFSARQGMFKLHVGEQEALAGADAAFGKGQLVLGAATGTARLRKLTVQGRVNPAEIDKRFAEVEVLVRRALESDLRRKKKTPEDEVEPLSAEDEHFLAMLDEGQRADYDRARASVTQALRHRKLQIPHLTMFDPIIKAKPGFAPPYYWRASVLTAARRADDARRDLARAVEANPDFVEAWHGLALMALEEKDLEAVAAAVKKALELAPGHAEALGLGGFVKFAKGDQKGALADLELARAVDPDSEEAARYQRNVQNVLKGPQHLGAKFVKEFPHYVVMTDISPEKTLLYGSRLEAAWKHYAETFPGCVAEDPKRPKPRVAVFNTREAYLTYGELTLSGRQEWTLGYFHPLYKELLLFEDVDQEATLQTLYHEAFHQFMSLVVRKVPYWYNEGLAEYMGGIRVEVAKGQPPRIVERARVLAGRLRGLKAGLAMAMPFEAIMMQSPGQFYSGPVGFKYAQAWSMVHFFHEFEKGRHRPRIEAYFRKLKEGGDARAAFQAGFGDAKMDELQKEWLEYVKSLELPKK